MAVNLANVIKICVKSVLVLIIVSLTWIPVYMARILVSILGPILQPRLHSIVEENNAMFANIAHDEAPNMAILLTTTLQPGPSISLTELRKKFEALLKYKDITSGTAVYAKLKQNVELWGGFPFWVNEPHFQIQDHILQTNLQDDGLLEFKKKLLAQKFQAGKSPWEIHLIKGVAIRNGQGQEEVRDAILFKFHHCLLDGHGLTTLLVEQVCYQGGQQSKSSKIHSKQSQFFLSFILSPLKKLGLFIAFHFGALADFTKVVDWVPEENALHSSSQTLEGNNGTPHLVEITNLTVNSIRKARKLGGNVHYFAIILASITTAIRESFLKIGAKVPPTISCYSPLPHPKHPKTMGNYWWGLTIPLPVGVPGKEERLRVLAQFLAKEATPWRAGCTLKLQEMLGGLSRWQLSKLTDVNHFTVSVSDFGGPREELEAFGGRKLLGIDYLVGFPKGRMGIVWHGLSYNGSWHMNLMVDRAILASKEDVDAMAENCSKAITNF